VCGTGTRAIPIYLLESELEVLHESEELPKFLSLGRKKKPPQQLGIFHKLLLGLSGWGMNLLLLDTWWATNPPNSCPRMRYKHGPFSLYAL